MRALSDVVGSALEFDTSEELHQRLSKAYKTFENIEVVQTSVVTDFGREGRLNKHLLIAE